MPEETLPNQNLQTPQEPASTTQPVVKNEKPAGKSPILKYILIGVITVLIIAGFAGAFVLGTQKSNKSLATISTIPTLSENTSSNWQILSDNNFTFKYPKDWQTTNPFPGGPTNETIGLEQIGIERQKGTAPPIRGMYYENPNNLSLKDWEEQTQKTDQGLKGYYISNAKVTKSGENTYYSSNKGMCNPYYCDQVVIVSDNKIFIFQHLGLLKTDLTQDLNIYKEIFEEIVSTFKFTDSYSQPNTPSKSSTSNGASLENIRYTLPSTWTPKLQSDTLILSPSTGGYLSIKVYDYDGKTGRREFYCSTTNNCTESSTFTPTKIGNISGYKADALDNSGGGAEYFGDKGNKFYIISTYNPPSPNDFEKNFQNVLNSLIF